MHKTLFIFPFFFLCIFGCHKKSDTFPEWLKGTIDSISTVQEYEGTTVVRYKWNNASVYHIEIPISTCTYCELYTQSGTKIIFADETQFQDFLKNKTERELLWEWPDKLE